MKYGITYAYKYNQDTIQALHTSTPISDFSFHVMCQFHAGKCVQTCKKDPLREEAHNQLHVSKIDTQSNFTSNQNTTRNQNILFFCCILGTSHQNILPSKAPTNYTQDQVCLSH